ncbi:MAG TPA: hypothetical protein VMW69_07905 [Spirochaetia bacterium]|nr:hypothetical protein [Spirochaetia bacterium]
MKKRGERARTLLAAVVFGLIVVVVVSCARESSSDIQLVKTYHLPEFPHATVGQLMGRLLDEPRWSEAILSDGRAEIDVEGNLPVRFRVVLDPARSHIVSATLEINGVRQPKLVTEDLLSRVYERTEVDSARLLGRWVNEESYQRMLYLRPDGTFHMHSWPWDFGGEYSVLDRDGTIVLRPKPPLESSTAATVLKYTFSDSDHMIITDPDADILLASEPLVFQRE